MLLPLMALFLALLSYVSTRFNLQSFCSLPHQAP
jgi:hypothetical protein